MYAYSKKDDLKPLRLKLDSYEVQLYETQLLLDHSASLDKEKLKWLIHQMRSYVTSVDLIKKKLKEFSHCDYYGHTAVHIRSLAFSNRSTSILKALERQLYYLCYPESKPVIAKPTKELLAKNIVTEVLSGAKIEPISNQLPKKIATNVSTKSKLEPISIKNRLPNKIVTKVPARTKLEPTIHKNHDPSLSAEKYSAQFMKFMNQSPTAYHAVENFVQTLEAHSFTYLPERESWEDLILTNNRFYTTRNGTSLVAFIIGKDWEPGHGAGIVGAHTDSITARVKPISKKPSADGYRMMGTAPYSGGFSSVWWDRDLGLAGRVVVRNHEEESIETKLVHIPHAIARIPTLAPHFGAPANGPFNKETQMTPIIGLSDPDEDLNPTDAEKRSPLYGKHDLKLLRLIAQTIKVSLEDMLTMDLELFDTQPASLGGLDAEFLFCPRLDDKLCSYAGLFGLLESIPASEDSSAVNMVALFDNEEIGSETRQGAMGGLLQMTLDRLLSLHGDSTDELKRQTYANSYLVSSDVNHAINPNFTEVYLKDHSARLNVGVAVGLDSQGDLSTDAVSLALLEEIARRSHNTLQYTQTRNGGKEGSTIGPMLSAATGIRAIDIGIPQLSMHSLRATTGSRDIWLGVRLYKAIFEEWFKVDEAFKRGDL